MLLIALLVGALPAGSAAQGLDVGSDDGPWLRLGVSGSPFSPNGDGRRERIGARVRLHRPAELRVIVRDFDGRLVRTLLEGPRQAGARRLRWDGRDDAGRRQPAGPYRVIASAWADGDAASGEAWVTLADSRVYPRRPGIITVALDPGHGGELPGAVGDDGTREADLNLDIGMRLAAMLEGAGVGVILTRTTDAFVNDPAVDRTGDGVIDETDELAARPDAANEARADLFISIHNNTAVNRRVGGPSTFYWADRPFGPRSARLAQLVQAEMLAKLGRFQTSTWEPYDHGALTYPYYVLRGYDPPRLVRPTQMPAVLSEGLFLSHPRELLLLKQRRVRAAMAEAYYEAIARYLAEREAHVGYRLLEAPAEAAPGTRVVLDVEVRNAGSTPLRGWTLHAGIMPAPPFYEGRGRPGRRVGRSSLAALAPSQVRRVRLPVRLPDATGDWLVIVDAREPGGRRAARLGSPMLQVRISTAGPAEPADTAVPADTPEPVVHGPAEASRSSGPRAR
jgi:N-acetylmuramoyl-L-alanine amidase